MVSYSHRGEGMLYPELKNGQKILINTGYTVVEAIVDHEERGIVYPLNHKAFVRCDCYLIPSELDRLTTDIKVFAEYADHIIAKTKEGL